MNGGFEKSKGFRKSRGKTKVGEFKDRIGGLKKLSDLELEEIVKENGWAEEIAREWSGEDKIKMAQLRKFFDEVMRYKRERKDKNFDEIRTGILALRPNLAFAVGRGVIPRDFYEVMDKCMGKIKDLSDFEVFIKLLEAIVGYYKYYSMKHGR